MLLDTHNPYKPAVIDWPELDREARDRLVGLPIWDIAVQTEGKASTRVRSYADQVADPLLREAVLLNGFEEGRHKQVLAKLVAAYDVRLAPEPEYLPPRHAEWAFMVTGYSECIDSFFAFGLFAAGAAFRASSRPNWSTRFEPVMQEEARHILFFVNWVAWHRRNLAWWRRPWFWCKVAAVWAFLIGERIGLARSAGKTARRRRPGQQLHADRQQGGGRYRSVAGRADRSVPRRKRAPHGRLRPASVAAAGHAAPAGWSGFPARRLTRRSGAA